MTGNPLSHHDGSQPPDHCGNLSLSTASLNNAPTATVPLRGDSLPATLLLHFFCPSTNTTFSFGPLLALSPVDEVGRRRKNVHLQDYSHFISLCFPLTVSSFCLPSFHQSATACHCNYPVRCSQMSSSSWGSTTDCGHVRSPGPGLSPSRSPCSVLLKGRSWTRKGCGSRPNGWLLQRGRAAQ